MPSARKIAANRRNAVKSTGPRGRPPNVERGAMPNDTVSPPASLTTPIV